MCVGVQVVHRIMILQVLGILIGPSKGQSEPYIMPPVQDVACDLRLLMGVGWTRFAASTNRDQITKPTDHRQSRRKDRKAIVNEKRLELLVIGFYPVGDALGERDMGLL